MVQVDKAFFCSFGTSVLEVVVYCANAALDETMRINQAIEYADQLLYEQTGRHLSDLQSYIIQQSWQGRTYGQVASLAGYSEGHVKDVASQLWRLLSRALGERITKGNLRSRLINRIKRTLKKAAPAGFLVETPTATSLDFIGREQALLKLHSLCQQHHIVVIHGEGGLGKTALAQQYCQQFDPVLELLVARETDQITSIESVVEEWLRQHFNEQPGKEFGITLSRLKYHLQHQNNAVVLIDNLEPALAGSGQFIGGLRQHVELLRVLATTKTTTIITSRDRLCEPSLKVHHYRLPSLSLSVWQQFFYTHIKAATAEADTQKVDPDTATLQAMHQAYGGNAKAMEVLCTAVIEDFEGDLNAYWQAHSTNLLASADLQNLMSSQINRLRETDLETYKVFCRLGCDRVPHQLQLTAEAILALMWDIPLERRRRVLNSLRDRSLLAFHKGSYRLHLATKAEASRLYQREHQP